MTDPTYETESHHTPESRDRDARLVGHDVKADLVKRLRSLSDCDARAGEPLGKCMREAANRIEALEAEAEGAHAVIAVERAEVLKLRQENERLREDLKNAAEVMAVYCDPMNMTPEHEMFSTLIINRTLKGEHHG